MPLMYCKKCGRLVIDESKGIRYCDCCRTPTYEVPKEFLEEGIPIFLSKEIKEKFIEDYIKSAPEFDPNAYKMKDKILTDRHKRWAQTEAICKGRDKGNPFGIECPYCHATNVVKISTSSKLIHTALFGVFSVGRNSKEWHCTHCDSDF